MEEFPYREEDLLFEIDDKFCSDSKFDSLLKSKWASAMNSGYFRYRLQDVQSRTLTGKFRFIVQLNVKRATERRKPQEVSDIDMPFDSSSFNFTKVPSHEILFNVQRESKLSSPNDISNQTHFPIIINVSPLEFCHSILVPEIERKLPQILTAVGLQRATECLLLSSGRDLRAGFNSLGAYASVNHCHLHLYYLDHRLYLEKAKANPFQGECYVLENYPAECFVFQVTSLETLSTSITAIEKMITFLLENKIAHNVFVTRGTRLDDSQSRYDAVRIYIWARSSTFGAKDSTDFNIAVCELSGHIPTKNERSFENTTEKEMEEALYAACHETFSKHLLQIKDLYR